MQLPHADLAIVPLERIAGYLLSDVHPEGRAKAALSPPIQHEEQTMSRPIFRELDLVALQQDLPSHGLIVGDVGTVVLVHADGAAYEVELMTADGRTLVVETLLAEQVEAVAGGYIRHARKYAGV